MFSKPSMIARVTVGKTAAAILMLVSWWVFNDIISALSWQHQIGFALWYILLGAVIGAFGMIGHLPVINTTLPWWLRGLWIGAWFNLILSLFIWDDLATYFSVAFNSGLYPTSPLLFTVEGAFMGLILDFLCTRIGGDAE